MIVVYTYLIMHALNFTYIIYYEHTLCKKGPRPLNRKIINDKKYVTNT